MFLSCHGHSAAVALVALSACSDPSEEHRRASEIARQLEQEIEAPTNSSTTHSDNQIAERPALNLRSGFDPDPMVVTGYVEAIKSSKDLTSSCEGMIQEDESEIVVAQNPFTDLHMLVESGDQESSLIVQKPNGDFLCSKLKKGGGHLSMMMKTGRYRVWIAGRDNKKKMRYRFGVSELEKDPTTLLHARVRPSSALEMAAETIH